MITGTGISTKDRLTEVDTIITVTITDKVLLAVDLSMAITTIVNNIVGTMIMDRVIMDHAVLLLQLTSVITVITVMDRILRMRIGMVACKENPVEITITKDREETTKGMTSQGNTATIDIQ